MTQLSRRKADRWPPASEVCEFVCSDMWKPYLGVIREKCSQALNILNCFHIVAKVNKALDEIRSAEARRMKGDGYEPVLTKSRSCLLKRPENLTAKQKLKLRDLVRYNLRSVRAYLLDDRAVLDRWPPLRETVDSLS